jgi:outer membrane protein W
MNSKWKVAAAATMGSMLITGAAGAQEKDQVQSTSDGFRSLAPATHDVELTIATGYEQAFGKVASGQPKLQDIGEAGGAVQLGAGYRLIPQLTLGVYGSGAMFARADEAEQSTKVYSAAAGVQADWHFLPAGHEFDPWLSLGTGWRGYWATDQGTNSMQGMELAKLQIGLDYRVDESLSLSPVVGVDLSTFFTQSTPAAEAFHNISNPDVNTFLFAGVQGRFDIPSGKPSQVASR